MSETTTVSSAEVGQRWAAALSARYSCPKSVAQAFDCEVRTAEAWMKGQAPQGKVFVRAWQLHGAVIIAEILAPGSDWASAAAIDAALVEVDAKIDELEGKIAHLRIIQDGKARTRTRGGRSA